jgi:hypothetical protein
MHFSVPKDFRRKIIIRLSESGTEAGPLLRSSAEIPNTPVQDKLKPTSYSSRRNTVASFPTTLPVQDMVSTGPTETPRSQDEHNLSTMSSIRRKFSLRRPSNTPTNVSNSHAYQNSDLASSAAPVDTAPKDRLGRMSSIRRTFSTAGRRKMSTLDEGEDQWWICCQEPDDTDPWPAVSIPYFIP